ncbi:hypothetical protein GCM10028774_15330 [Spirosoma jeollabukense]
MDSQFKTNTILSFGGKTFEVELVNGMIFSKQSIIEESKSGGTFDDDDEEILFSTDPLELLTHFDEISMKRIKYIPSDLN